MSEKLNLYFLTGFLELGNDNLRNLLEKHGRNKGVGNPE